MRFQIYTIVVPYAPITSDIDVLEISVIKQKFVRISSGGDWLKYSNLLRSYFNKLIKRSAEAIFSFDLQ